MKIEKILESVFFLNESAIDKITFNGIPYKMELDVTEAETKQGVRIKFTPLSDNVPASKEDITNMMLTKINEKLQLSGLSASIDNDGLDESTITFLLTVSQLVTLFKSAFNE